MTDFSLQRDALAASLRSHTGCEVRFDEGSRHLYSTDASIYRIEPLGVAIPRTTDDLRSAVQIALEMGVSIVPRGGGTSLSGQSIGPGLVIDCSKFLNQILELDVEGRRARVQPGVILDQLNRAAARHGLMFGPEVATANRANIGGMIGNNSAGSRSIVYGKTSDHVRSLNVLLADGSAIQVAPLDSTAWDHKSKQSSMEGGIYRQARALARQNADEIRRRFPNITRRVSGYNFEGLLQQLELPKSSLLPLMIGSEGTLGFVAEAELNLIARPAHRGLLVPHFNSMRAALDALALCLEQKPSAVELLDSMLISLAADNLALRDVMQQIEGHPAALLMVEFSSDDAGEVVSRIDRLKSMLSRAPGLTAAPSAIEPDKRDTLWNLRKAAVPLLYGMHGDRKPVTFVEDTAVAPERLPEFADRFRDVLMRHGTDGAFYGHASVGCLHIRPVLNLKDPNDVVRMRQIMVDISDLVLEFGGCLSGEHGDGLVRSEWNRKMFGPEVYAAFQQIKQTFDPKNLFNPGKVVDAAPMTENLRFNTASNRLELPTVFDYSKQEGFFRSIELCNGSGVCRKMQGGAMCPSFRATQDEADSTRGRANALRIALEEGIGKPDPSAPLAERWLYDVMDLCLMCKACKAECPSNVDLHKLKSEFLNAYYSKRHRPLGQRLIANVNRVNRIGSRFAGMANWLNRSKMARWFMEKVAGIDRRRPLPLFHSDDFRTWFDARPKKSGVLGPVYLLDDCFTTFNEPNVSRAAVSVLESAGYEVRRLDLACCGRTMISKGFLTEARNLAATQIPRVASLIRGGAPILGLEPSCLLTLTDEWPELAPSDDARQIAKSVFLVEDWLGEQCRTGRAKLSLHQRNQRVLFHGHCHQRAMCGVKGTAAAIAQIPGVDVKTLDAGCCGMAGSFGYEKKHYDLSVQIANLQLLPALANDAGATVAATGTSCRHQIRDLTGRTAMHPMELLAEALA